MRTLEQDEDRLVESVCEQVPSMEIARHIHHGPQPAIVAAPAHREGYIRGFGLHCFDDGDVVAGFANDDARRFLKQFGFRRLHGLAYEFRPLLHQHVQTEKSEGDDHPA
jgi:hypothetical protein